MDARLDAGRKQLATAESALEARDSEVARRALQLALQQFRGPELMLGEGHAYLGLARVEFMKRRSTQGLDFLTRAIQTYSEGLGRVPSEDSYDELRQHLSSGLAAAHIVASRELLKRGRAAEASERLTLAAARLPKESSVEFADLWVGYGRLYRQQGQYADARVAYERAISLFEELQRTVELASSQLELAEILRVQGKKAEHAKAILTAHQMASSLHDPGLRARVLTASALLALREGRRQQAIDTLLQAKELLEERGDVDERLGALQLHLAEAKLDADGQQVLTLLRDGYRHQHRLEQHHSAAGAMLLVSEYAMRVGQPTLALCAAEVARLIWRTYDPIRGVGMAQRLQIKALHALGDEDAAFHCAVVRQRLCGHLTPHAKVVSDWYRARVDEQVVAAVDGTAEDALWLKAEECVRAHLIPALEEIGIQPMDLAAGQSGLMLIDWLAARVSSMETANTSPPDDPELQVLDEEGYIMEPVEGHLDELIYQRQESSS